MIDRLIIAGGRNYYFLLRDYVFLDTLPTPLIVHYGGCKGADACGKAWAMKRNIATKEFRAQWHLYGRSAGPMRNRLMAENSDAVVLFSGGKGTDSMHREAVRRGLKIYDRRGL